MAYESILWAENPVSGMTRADMRNLGRPYQAAVTASIADLDVRLSAKVAAEAEEAAVVIAEFDAQVGREVAPFAAVLLRTESSASSQIEQLSASARRIAEAELNGSGTENAVQIVGNVRAMNAALRLSDNLDAVAVLEMHRELMSRWDPDTAGRWRQDQVWIGGSARFGVGSPHDAVFVPPSARRVPEAIDDLMAFAGRQDLPVIPQVAVAHAQFETIHPFSDGNGRTGRALMHSLLRAKRLTKTVSVPISAGLLTDTDAYYAALTDYRQGNVESMVSCVSRAALSGVDNGRALVRELEDVRSAWDDKLSGLRADSGARTLAAGLLAEPVIDAAAARRLTGVAKNEHRHIDVLVERGLLKLHVDYKTRNRTWRADDVLAALDNYAGRAGRRRFGQAPRAGWSPGH